eukprot:Hpha_TRINITY_DN31090_c0_g1::TRINITY_DN31090_c0_g1_i1::g.63977::m.63977
MACAAGLRLTKAVKALREEEEGRGEGPEEALIAASRIGNTQRLRLLLRRGVHQDVKDEFGRTPLYLAVWWGREACWRLLLRRGADPGKKADTSPQYTPLHAAAFQADYEAAVALLCVGGASAGLRTRDACGRTPLELSEFRAKANPFRAHKHDQVTRFLRTAMCQLQALKVFLLVARRELRAGCRVAVRIREQGFAGKYPVRQGVVLNEGVLPGYYWVKAE